MQLINLQEFQCLCNMGDFYKIVVFPLLPAAVDAAPSSAFDSSTTNINSN